MFNVKIKNGAVSVTIEGIKGAGCIHKLNEFYVGNRIIESIETDDYYLNEEIGNESIHQGDEGHKTELGK
jgi:hypothetical protein